MWADDIGGRKRNQNYLDKKRIILKKKLINRNTLSSIILCMLDPTNLFTKLIPGYNFETSIVSEMNTKNKIGRSFYREEYTTQVELLRWILQTKYLRDANK